MSKAPAAWSLRYKSPADFPNIAKFGDDLEWNQAHQPLQMYFKEEELKEDDVVEVQKDSEYYRRKRERRRNYRKKNTLVLEDSAPPGDSTGFRFEGKICNLGLADIEDAKSKAAEVKEAPFRYVLLQFVKKENESGGQSSEINVIPVGDMFALKRASYVQDELLADVDERFIQEVQRNKGNINKYKGISKSLTAAERNRLGLRADDEHGDGRQMGLNAKEFLGGFGSNALFGAAVNRAFGSEKAARSTASANAPSFLNENGMDVDELHAQTNNNEGDYSTRFVDDEEEYVTVEQSRNQVMAEQEISAAQRHSEYEEEDRHSDEDSDEEASGKDVNLIADEHGMVDHSMLTNATEARGLFATKGKDKGKSGDSVGGVGINSSVSSGVTAANTLANTRIPTIPTTNTTAKSAMKRNRNVAFGEDSVNMIGAVGMAPAERAITPTGVAGTTSIAGTGGTSGTGATSGTVVTSGGGRGVKFDDNANTSTAVTSTTPATTTPTPTPTSTTPTATTTTTTSTTTTTEYPLTEQGLRAFIRNKGGKVPTVDMNFFKPQLKACEKSVRKRFMDMVLNITVEVDDPILGKVLVFK